MKSIDEFITRFEAVAEDEETYSKGLLEDGWQVAFLNLTPERENEIWEGRKQTSKEAEERAQDCRNVAEWLRRAKKYTGWIPVSERLPEENGRYLCSYKYKEGECIDFGSFKDGTWYVKGAVAWMPLPEPYKAESED